MLTIKLDNLAYGGECVGHTEGNRAIFVPRGIPGELVRVKIEETKKNYARARIQEILRPSPERKEADCSLYGDCGGCQLQHIKYKAQLRYKQRMVRDTLERIGKLEHLPLKEIIGSDYPWHYRNKGQFPLMKDSRGRLRAGFYRRGTHDIIAIEGCRIQHPLINRIVRRTVEILNDYPLTVYNEEEHRGLLRHLVVRAGVCTNQALLIFVTTDDNFSPARQIADRLLNKIPELRGVFRNINPERTNVIMGQTTEILAGRERYTEYIGRTKYEISPGSFFQVNTLQSEKLYEKIREFTGSKKVDSIVDCYCGIGSIAIYLSGGASDNIIGIEEAKEAVLDARRNAVLNSAGDCKFILGRVGEILSGITAPDILIFDPPRKGLEDRVVTVVKKLLPEEIIYVSCNPATLARDIKLLSTSYRVREIQPVDMFPQTYHVECVALLKKRA